MSQPAAPRTRFLPFRTLGCVLLLGLAYTAANTAKPLLVDDAAYEYYARQFARHPLDPYGFAVYWYYAPEPANEVLAPPVLPAYWGLARSLVGENPLLWKLALWPWALLLVGALYTLARRFCPGFEWPTVILIVFSPALLPSFNLMLDVPALALSLAALALFCHACDQRSWAWAAGAGFLAGLAMQTKYTGGLAPAVMLVYALLQRRPLLGALAALMAAQVFVTWETLTALLYGDSHFLVALGDGGNWLDKVALLPYLFSQLGGLIPAALLLALAALGLRSRGLLLAGALFALGYGLVATIDRHYTIPSEINWPGGRLPLFSSPLSFHFSEIVFDCFCAVGVVLLVLVIRRLWRGERSWHPIAFLLLWLGLEVLGYTALTPFPAVRRVLGTWVVGGLILGRLAGQTLGNRPGTVRVLMAGAVWLAVAFLLIDVDGARIHQMAAEQAAQWVRERSAGRGWPRVWYVGHWGFQFYAERLGMRPVVTSTYHASHRDGVDLPAPSRLRRGDWLVRPDARLNQQGMRITGMPLELVETLVIPSHLPVRTVVCFYGGETPLLPRQPDALAVRLYRVTADFTPEYAEPEE
jgi:hypothetical protein